MKQFWLDLKENRAFKGVRYVDSIIDVKNNTATFYLCCSPDFTGEDAVRRSIKEEGRISGFTAETVFSFDKVELNSADEVGKYVSNCLAANKPIFREILKKTDWTLTDTNVITMTINDSELKQIFIDQKLLNYIQTNISRRSTTQYRIRLSDVEAKDDEAAYNEYREHLEELDEQQLELYRLERKKNKGKGRRPGDIIYGSSFAPSPVPISSLREETGRAMITGKVIKVEEKELNSGKTLFFFGITDLTGSITVKLFEDTEKMGKLREDITTGKYLNLRGTCMVDNYAKELIFNVRDITVAEGNERKDNAAVKRVELHLHTKFSKMDSSVEIKQLFKTLKSWGHDAVAITDHGVVQGFPNAYSEAKKAGIKPLLGVEAYLVNDALPIVTGADGTDFNGEFVVFDVETTGLSALSERLTEIGAVKIKNKEIVDRYSTFVNPGKPIPAKITELTGITNDMVKEAPSESEIIKEFHSFCKGSVLVAHNASFDMSFIRAAAQRSGLNFEMPVLDTLALSRAVLKDLKKHKLNILADYFGIDMGTHHRAVHDAQTTVEILLKLFELLEKRDINNVDEINTGLHDQMDYKKAEVYHAIIFAKNKKGLFNLYKLITDSHLNNFYRRPRILKSMVNKYRDGLILGSACEQGEIYKAVLAGADNDSIRDLVGFYDYLEIQPRSNNRFLIREGVLKDEEAVLDINRKIIKLAKFYNKPFCATCDVHFLEQNDAIFRKIIMAANGFTDVEDQADLYLRTTEEMLEEFQYLGADAEDAVINNPRKIADMIEEMEPFPSDRLYTPELDGVEEEIKEVSYATARSIYGEELPEIVEKRLQKELNAIVGNGYTVLYSIARRVVLKSLSDGYLVGSRGSVGSSFVATMMGITEVNPLPPHYVCPECKFSDFNIDTMKYGCGIDMPEKDCPHCGTTMKRLGFDIPFEVFMGFKGNKAPDIDLNFSGVYQPVAHKYVEELFGENHVFRAGTMSSLAEKQCYGYVLKYHEERGIPINKAELERLVAGIINVKKTTGQHPGGIVVLPKSYDIHEFTPLQYPADDTKCGIITTHFDFNTLHDTLVKLDLLGHDDPTMIRMLSDLTGIDARTLPLDDPKVMSLFLSTEALGVTPEQIFSDVGTYGLPELGTGFVRKMLVETKPTTFAELIKISGLSHGTDVWTNNAQILVREGVATLSELICTREDIMNYLVQRGVEAVDAFTIMESVRKGKGLTPDMERIILEHELPPWYMDSCKKIKYMFPKAHAAAYIMMALRIAYFKVYYPKEFYTAFFTVRADDFDISYFNGGIEKVCTTLDEFSSKNDINAREKGIRAMLEIGLEMMARGISFANVDIFNSRATEFYIDKETGLIVPPLTAIAGLGASVADSIVKAREEKPFTSIDDIKSRCKVSKTVLEVMGQIGAVHDLPEKSQVSIFEL